MMHEKEFEYFQVWMVDKKKLVITKQSGIQSFSLNFILFKKPFETLDTSALKVIK